MALAVMVDGSDVTTIEGIADGAELHPVHGVYGAGRIINPLAARSQMIGGITWGLGQALLERSIFEPTLGRFLSKNLAGYIIPSNADVGDIDVSS